MKVFLRGAAAIEQQRSAQRLVHGWMAANLEGDKVNDAVKALTERGSAESR
jgi:hypothetical protein